MKACTKCKQIKEFTEFFKANNTADGYYSMCKACKTAATLEHRKKNPPKYNDYMKKWRGKNPDKQHATDIKRLYKLPIEEYNKMLAAQNCQCKICGKHHDPSKKRGRLYVDHCHRTGKIRGLLCSACNCALGYLNDDTGLIEKAIAYITKTT